MYRNFFLMFCLVLIVHPSYSQDNESQRLLFAGLNRTKMPTRTGFDEYEIQYSNSVSYIGQFTKNAPFFEAGLSSSNPLGGFNASVSAYLGVGFLKSWRFVRIGGFIGPVYMYREYRVPTGEIVQGEDIETRREAHTGIGLHQSVLITFRFTKTFGIRVDQSNEVSESNNFVTTKVGLEYGF